MTEIAENVIRNICESPGHVAIDIRPNDISVGDIKHPFLPSTFGKAEVESVAGRLVSFFQQKNYWSLFTLTELMSYYRLRNWNPDTALFGLMGVWYDDCYTGCFRKSHANIVTFDDGTLCVTEEFIRRCAKKLA